MRTIFVSLFLAIIAGLAYTGDATAQLSPPCGVVTDNTTLKSDCEGPMLVLASKVNINLGGHAVRCTGAGLDGSDPNRMGIVVVSQTDVHLLNGTVEKCGTGILLSGGGDHHLSNLEVLQNRCCGLGGDGDGISLASSHDNQITNVTSSFNHSHGVELNSSHRNGLKNLVLEQNAGPAADGGVLFFASNDNTLASSILLGNGDYGVRITAGSSGTTVESSTFTLQNNDGIPVAGTYSGFPTLAIALNVLTSNTTIRGNRMTQNGGGVGAGFISNSLIQANEITLSQNNSGIHLEIPALNNTIQANRAFNNLPFDLQDDNPGCDANVWKANQFATANQPCIQ